MIARIAALALVAISLAAADAGRVTTSFDSGWRFFQGDAAGAENPSFADATWRAVNVPHDWSIEGPFDEKNPTGGGGGFLPSGVGWYRRQFTLPASYAARRVFIEFDGVMANSEVSINGFHLGKRPYGYVSFEYELTGHVNFGAKKNLLVVRTDTSAQPASRWYTGAGIYRHVRLVVTNPVHIDHWATFVTTPKITSSEATVRVQTTVVNQSNAARTAALEITILDPKGKPAGTIETKPQPVEPGKSVDFAQDIDIKTPQLWDLDHPALYRAVAKIHAGKETLDDETVPFGIREFHFDPATGFWLNGRNFKIKGVALHHDASALGAAVPLRAWERRLEQLRLIGVNAIRTAHNPAAPEFLDLCDRMGFLVMDEMFDCWTVAKNRYDYHLYFRDWSAIDTRDTVRRDRNHPSIIVYSAGNEIHDTPKADLAKGILRTLLDVFHLADPTRPVTQALFRPNVSHDYDNGLADMLDVVGQNYRENEILAAHRAKPERKILGTENQQGRDVWLALRDNAPYSGQFLWSGIDYLGEAGRWPLVAAGSGLLDRTGAFKPIAYERQSWWSDKPMVHITRRVAPSQAAPTDPGYEPTPRRRFRTLFDDWSPANPAVHNENVEIYSNCEEVELQLNGQSFGSKPLPADASARTWRVPFQPGIIKAIGKNRGAVVATDELCTAAEPVRISLATDRAKLAFDWNDVAYVTVRLVDSNGVQVPTADNLITFGITGPGIIAAVDNADNASHESYRASQRQAFEGRCIAILRATTRQGRITLTAQSSGVPKASINLDVR
ncbi:MAG TPA: glycoside hydrolase family 2 TIM barrel-domain containing protein [Bryobacteraceae bacterium]|nr:glycoside hydrolase family 2 TIM barrel-domain containing protein [Bryobacteraceae bacterium]